MSVLYHIVQPDAPDRRHALPAACKSIRKFPGNGKSFIPNALTRVPLDRFFVWTLAQFHVESRQGGYDPRLHV